MDSNLRNLINQMDNFSVHCLVCGYRFAEAPGPDVGGYWRICSAAEAIAQCTYHWQSRYRLIIFDPIQETHTLSGLGQWVMPWDDDTQETSNNEFVVPMDRDLAICGWPTVDDIESIVRVPKAISLEFRQDRTSGCPVHMRCWNYVERVLGPEAEENLGLLYRVFRDRYQECEYERLTNANMIAFTKDPFESKEVRRLIQRSLSPLPERKRRAKKKYPAKRRRRRAKPLQNCLPSRFPLDVQYIILDLLDFRDISKMRLAIDWPVGQQYWRYRAPKTFVHELQDIPEDDHYVDWEYLCLGAERLSKRCLHGRRAVLEMLRGPRDVFHRLLMEERMK